MKLFELLDDALKKCDAQINIADKNVVVTGITDNTSDVQQGYIFVCVKGTKFDGHTAAKDMLDKGAVCVVTEHDLKLENQIITFDSRKLYGMLCAAWFGHPEKRMSLVGITGTNGKTTMTTLIKEILAESGHKVGFIGTTGAEINGVPVKTDEATPTTPRVYELYKLFKQMADSGCTSVVMEVSSFALEQNRIGPARYKAAVFTNLTQDHLDYHGTMENYYQAKKKLFTEHCDAAVINKQDPYGARLYSEISCEKYTYAVKKKASVFGDNIKVTGGTTKFWFCTHEKSYPITLNMIGEYNVGNAVTGNMSLYRLTKPVMLDLDADKSTAVVEGVFGLMASQIAAVMPEKEQLEEYGLADPFAEITMDTASGQFSMKVGSKYTDADGKQTGYYCYVNGIDIVYVFDKAVLPWVTVKPEDITTSLITTNYVYTVSAIDIKTAGGETHFTMTGNAEDNFAVKLDGKDMSADLFKSFYQFILSAPANEIYLEDTDTEPSLTVTIKHASGTDTIEFIPSADRKCIVKLNGAVSFRCSAAYAERLASNLELVKTGENIITTW